MTRVLVNHASLIKNAVSGVSVYAWCILEALVRHGRHEYALATNWDLDAVPAGIRALGIPIEANRTPGNEALTLLHNTRALPALARRHGCTRMLHTGPTAMLSGLGSSAVVVHDLYRVTHPGLHRWRQRAQWRWFTARAIRGAGAVIAVSQATADDLARHYPEVRARVAVVHEASPLARSRPDPPSLLAGRYGLMVANLTPNKNVATLVAALRRLRAEGLRTPFMLAGRDERGALPGLLAGDDLGIDHRPGISEAELRSLYAHARVLVAISLTEGFCLPVLEAHTHGLPVIASDLPVLCEVAGEGAVFVDPRDPDALARAIRAVMHDDALAAALRERALANAARFSWERAARETEAVLDGLPPR